MGDENNDSDEQRRQIAEKSANRFPIAFRADVDALCGQDGKPGHYCGHDGHSSILCGTAVLLSRMAALNRDVYFIFQPGEEICPGAPLSPEVIAEKKKHED